jgi:hypothetical protein
MLVDPDLYARRIGPALGDDRQDSARHFGFVARGWPGVARVVALDAATCASSAHSRQASPWPRAG